MAKKKAGPRGTSVTFTPNGLRHVHLKGTHQFDPSRTPASWRSKSRYSNGTDRDRRRSA